MSDMEINNKWITNFGQVTQDGVDEIYPALDELIAEIDRETGEIPGTDTGKEQGLELTGGSTPVQNQFILFDLEGSQFALPLSSALEIGLRPDITPLPNLPKWVLGISNIRGEIISLVDLKSFLGISSAGGLGDRRFIVIHNREIKVGVIVDKIKGIVSLDRINSQIQSSPYREGEVAKYIQEVAVSGTDIMNILDIGQLLSSPRMTGFRAN
jgi:purine-binding chemotaxis protein CheW